MGADFDDRSLPAEAGLDDAIDYGKGCFLGQEAVAKVRNLGHPARVLRHVRVPGSATAGDPIFADGAAVGELTSATHEDGSTVAIARVRWNAEGPLTLRDGRTAIDVPRQV
jgi:folate-binding protein YgfZ